MNIDEFEIDEFNIDEFESFPINKQLEIVVSQGKVKYVKKLVIMYRFDNNIIDIILRRLGRYITNNPNLENINDYVSIRQLLIQFYF